MRTRGGMRFSFPPYGTGRSSVASLFVRSGHPRTQNELRGRSAQGPPRSKPVLDVTSGVFVPFSKTDCPFTARSGRRVQIGEWLLWVET